MNIRLYNLRREQRGHLNSCFAAATGGALYCPLRERTQRGKTNQATHSIAAVTGSLGGDRLSVRKTSHARGHDKRNFL